MINNQCIVVSIEKTYREMADLKGVADEALSSRGLARSS